jgi:uncharacterized HAD superfamily protein
MNSRAVIFDLDGTLCDVDHRIGYYHESNYDMFNDKCDKDMVIHPIASLLDMFVGYEYKIVIMTGRPDTFEDKTVDWLVSNHLRWDELMMRPEGEMASDSDVKYGFLKEIDGTYDVKYAIDDRSINIKMFEEFGITTLKVKGDL